MDRLDLAERTRPRLKMSDLGGRERCDGCGDWSARVRLTSAPHSTASLTLCADCVDAAGALCQRPAARGPGHDAHATRGVA